MRFLIDTHALIWYLDGNTRLPNKIRDQINDVDNSIIISVVSLWEFAIKLNLKKIDTKIGLAEIQAYIKQRDFNLLNISFEHLNELSDLSQNHGDPFDCLLIAQAIAEDMIIISADKQFESYPIKVIW